MIITRLKLTNLRAIEDAAFEFERGFNLLVGVNGVGKSTVLDAIRICTSRFLRSISASRSRSMSFGTGDIRVGSPFLDVSLTAQLGDTELQFNRWQWREHVTADDEANLDRLRGEILGSERLRDRARNLLRELETTQEAADTDLLSPSESTLRQAAQGLPAAPNCVFFGTDRAVVGRRKTPSSRSAGGQAAAYSDALVSRPWQVRQFSDWMRAQAALAPEMPIASRHLAVLRNAVRDFLPDYGNMRPDELDSSRLLIDRGSDGLEVGQLSDGERGVLGMVLDLARRLSQANPDLEDPLREGSAVVLIDELDLHLHPSWQRQFVHKLVSTFPNCQFIATTHSPQVIGEVPHERIQIIADGHIYSPTHSFGVDSSRVLEEIMEADPRAKEIQELLSRISRAIGKQQFDHGGELIGQLSERLGETDPEVTRLRTLLDFVEGKE